MGNIKPLFCNKTKLIFMILILVFLAILLSSCSLFLRQVKMPNLSNNIYMNGQDYNYHQESEEICLIFIKNKLSSGSKGIYTNYVDTDNIDSNMSSKLAVGHEILTESVGLIMQYYINKSAKKSYDQYIDYLKDYFLTDEGVLRWRVREDVSYSRSSATLDDLRIIRTLVFAYNKWGDRQYLDLYNKIAKGFLNKETYEDNLISGYDTEFNQKFININLSYIDLYTLNLLVEGNKNLLKDIYINSYQIIQDGYISNSLPFYYNSYDFISKTYSKTSDISMIDNLMVVLHLSEMGLVRKETMTWLNQRMKNNQKIYSKYNIRTGKAVSNIESTAIYALLARIYKNSGNQEMYNLAIKEMLRFQVKNTSSEMYGSFANEKTREAYSFDNLQALLAF